MKTVDLISVEKASNIQIGTIFKPEKPEILRDKEVPKTNFLVRLGYGGSIFLEDNFNNQFLNQNTNKIYAGCLDLHAEGLIASSHKFLFGGGAINLTTGQYTTIDSGPIFQNLSIGPLLKVRTFKNTFWYWCKLLACSRYNSSVSHKYTKYFSRKVHCLRVLERKNLNNWAFGIRLKSVDHKIKFQDDLNTFKNTKTSLSIGAYVSKGLNFFSI